MTSAVSTGGRARRTPSRSRRRRVPPQAMDVGALLEAAALTLSRVEELGPTRLNEFDWGLAPRISLVEPHPEALRGET